MGYVPNKIHRIKLASDERSVLEDIRDHGSHKSSKFKRALALLLADESDAGPAMKDAEISKSINVSIPTLQRLRKRCCEVGPLGALEAKPRETPPREIKITGEVQAHITQIACSKPPQGHARWTLSLIAQKLVEIEVVDSIGRSSICMVLKKANLNLGSKNNGASHQNKTRLS